MRKPFLSAMCALALLPSPALAQSPPSQVGATVALPGEQTGRSFVQYMWMIDKYERAAGRMAERRGQSAAVRELGRDMIVRHQALSRDLARVADHTQVGNVVTPPPAFDPPRQRLFGELSQTPDSTFDRAFIAQQIAVHREALAYAQGYVDHGGVPRLRAHARQMVPVLRDHLAVLQGLGGAAVAVN